ncbi:hypothetical protein SAICODRAFT_23544 [Saitoella complicata NRRL Y-17804]|uniref:DUF7721 domain-containing protein n=1 Tax=Saitoella complicata (strain BCRC 22490 / CBS 7301 / JCM 7358 / NBRC 10748 / NRRL Y-17804) TaxID=698492 RepID=A0A0E9NLL4_SAICN|nr:uncharacterized protein SAICODRAFT_23544 [Saitoella complicata NRRL Y-17804]ODQ55511.1 hypothetical protein SAICODRAFT_23544 [Saitoella complicata NRRL Y-17804]GAO50772.1 hypothetical protein G7K_4893-t1 [Saitoella complicata NRRL Y-17804]
MDKLINFAKDALGKQDNDRREDDDQYERKHGVGGYEQNVGQGEGYGGHGGRPLAGGYEGSQQGYGSQFPPQQQSSGGDYDRQPGYGGQQGYSNDAEGYNPMGGSGGEAGSYYAGQHQGSYEGLEQGRDPRYGQGAGNFGTNPYGGPPTSSSMTGGGGFGAMLSQLDFGNAQNEADKYADKDEDKGFFAEALDKLKGDDDDDDIDEEKLVRSHQAAYSGGQTVGSGGIGNAAALQTMKMLMGGGSGGSSMGGMGGMGGQSQSSFVGMAMAQAAKLFDNNAAQGNVAGGANKQDAISQAAKTAMKLYMKSQMSGGSGAGGGLMSMLGKFM